MQIGSIGAKQTQAAHKTLSKSEDLTVLNSSTSWGTSSHSVARGGTHKNRSKSGDLKVLSAGVGSRRDKAISISGGSSSDTVSVENDSDIEPKEKVESSSMRGEPTVVLARPLGKSKKKAIETFAGCGRLAGELQKVGFEAIGIDCKDNKDRPVSKVINMDLTTAWGQNAFWREVDNNTTVVSFAPPCGTSSRSREIRRRFGPDPKPLRSDEFPDGLPSLTGKGKERVEAANALYKFTADAVLKLHHLGISWFVENPSNSLMWKTLWFKSLLTLLAGGCSWMNTQMCMHGGDRDKKSSLLHGGELCLMKMAVMCDKNHAHKPWGSLPGGGGFATAAERNYPLVFCQRIARIAAATFAVNSTRNAPDEQTKTAAGKQPRRSHSDLIKEFTEVLLFHDAAAWQVERLKNSRDPDEWFQCGSLLVPGRSKVIDISDDGTSGSIGIWWSKAEFIEKALRLVHPLDKEVIVPQRIANALYNQAILGPKGLGRKRSETLQWYKTLSMDLKGEEEKLHKALHPDVEKVVSKKRILTFKRMLEDIDYDDLEVVDLLINGVKVAGKLERTGIWAPSTEKGPQCSVNDLWANARRAQKKVVEPRAQHDSELEEEVWKETAKEVTAGLLVGPLEPDDLEERVGPLWVAARRFGIRQGKKIRPIDNFAEHMVNDAFGAEEKISLLSIDHVVAWSRAWASAGELWACWLHEGWCLATWTDLVGRVADLKGAYKQVAVHPANASVSIVAVQEPGSFKVRLFRALALMFGETAAVYAFLRLSRAIAALATRLFDLVVVEFFDDFTQVESKTTSESALKTLERLFELLGWEVSEGDKRLIFGKSFVSLGVQVGFEGSSDGVVSVTNKPGRIEGIEESVNGVVKQGSMGFKEALSIKGKISFAEGQMFGRVAAPVCRLLSAWASSGIDRQLDPTMVIALTGVCNALRVAKPRYIAPPEKEKPIVIFTDGACEDAVTSIGGVLFEVGRTPEMFGAVISAQTIRRWISKAGQKQVIGQAEIFPMLVARLTWSKRLVGRKVLFFVDNDSARLACIKSYSPVSASLEIIMKCVEWDGINDTSCWYARAPTDSNVADGPSRMDGSLVTSLGAKIVRPIFPAGDAPADVL